MKKIKIIFVVLLCAGISTAFCQNNTSAQPAPTSAKKIKITDASLYGGVMTQNLPITGSFADFQKLSPQSVLLGQDMTGFSIEQNWYDMGFSSSNPSGSVFGASLGFSFKEKEKSVAQLRCGIAVSGINIANRLYKRESTPHDTLVSNQSGQTIYQDSITSQYYNMKYFAKQVRLDVSLIYRVYPSSRWSLYGGVGLEGGTSLMAYTDVTYTKYVTIEGNASSNDLDEVYLTERVLNKDIQEFVAYLPLGIDFRVGKKREFLKQIHLFSEFRPFISKINIPELGSFSSTGIKNAFGLRVTI